MKHVSKILTLFLISTAAFVFLAGCNDKYSAIPADTILGANYQSNAEWIDDEEVYSEQGLALRGDNTFHGRNVSEYAGRPAMTSVYFGFDQANIAQKERPKLPDVVKILEKDPHAGILIIGHCDWQGTQEHNVRLGDRRSKSIESYLEDLGADIERVCTLSKGSLEATLKGSPEECWQDRRTDIIVMR